MLHQAVRTYELSDSGKLDVLACVGEDCMIDPIWLSVQTVRRTYGGLQFDGVLKNTSRLLPTLYAGLPMRFEGSRVLGWRMNGEQPTFRVQAP